MTDEEALIILAATKKTCKEMRITYTDDLGNYVILKILERRKKGYKKIRFLNHAIADFMRRENLNKSRNFTNFDSLDQLEGE